MPQHLICRGSGSLLDATIIRMLLVPFLVSTFDRWNWWVPTLPARRVRVHQSKEV